MSDPYWPEIKGVLSAGVGCMNGLSLSNDDGVFEIYLDQYDSVVRFGALIAVALDGWRRTADGSAWAVNDRGDTIPVKPHAMPPGGPLAIDKVDRVKLWVQNGMPKDPPSGDAPLVG